MLDCGYHVDFEMRGQYRGNLYVHLIGSSYVFTFHRQGRELCNFSHFLALVNLIIFNRTLFMLYDQNEYHLDSYYVIYFYQPLRINQGLILLFVIVPYFSSSLFLLQFFCIWIIITYPPPLSYQNTNYCHLLLLETHIRRCESPTNAAFPLIICFFSSIFVGIFLIDSIDDYA